MRRVAQSASNFLSWLGRGLDAGWFSRLLVIAQFVIVWKMIDWSWSYASTSLSLCAAAKDAADAAAKCNHLGIAGVIAAVAAVPQALLLLATNKYIEMRAQQPVLMQDRRKPQPTDGGA